MEEKKETAVLVFPDPPDEPRFYFERAIYGSADVEVFEKKEESLQDLLTGGSSGPVNHRFKKPFAIAVHKGRIFVSEVRAKIVRVFDVPEGRYFTIGEQDPGGLSSPMGLDVDAAGNLYVADAKAKCIMIYDRDGNFLRTLGKAKPGEPDMFKRLASVAVDKSGERIYVVDVGGVTKGNEAYHRVRVFDIATGELLFDIGKRGAATGDFNLPKDAAIGKDGQLYVVDSANFRIQVFDAQGKYLKDFGKLGGKPGGFGRPKEIATDRDGNMYVIDAVFANFQLFNAEGEFLMFIGRGGPKDAPARYLMPAGIYVDEDGRIYVVDQIYKKVEVFRPAALGPGDGYLGQRLQKGQRSADIVSGVRGAEPAVQAQGRAFPEGNSAAGAADTVEDAEGGDGEDTP